MMIFMLRNDNLLCWHCIITNWITENKKRLKIGDQNRSICQQLNKWCKTEKLDWFSIWIWMNHIIIFKHRFDLNLDYADEHIKLRFKILSKMNDIQISVKNARSHKNSGYALLYTRMDLNDSFENLDRKI